MLNESVAIGFCLWMCPSFPAWMPLENCLRCWLLVLRDIGWEFAFLFKFLTWNWLNTMMQTIEGANLWNRRKLFATYLHYNVSHGRTCSLYSHVRTDIRQLMIIYSELGINLKDVIEGFCWNWFIPEFNVEFLNIHLVWIKIFSI